MHFYLRIFLFQLGLVSCFASAETITYEIFTQNDKLAGSQTVDHQPNGVTKVHFTYRDNGRGPDLDEEYKLAADGTLKNYSVSGTSTMGSAVSESYSVRDQQALWKSTFDQGTQALTGPTHYLPVNGSLEAISISIGVLAKREGKALALIPSGTLTQRKVDEVKLKGKKLQLLAQTGIGFSPSFVWATVGTNPRLFAVVFPGNGAIVEKGWNPITKILGERQKIAEGKILREMAIKYRHDLKGLTLVRNVRIFDSEKAKLLEPSDVYILRGKITALRPAGSSMNGVTGVIDGAGRVVMPGMFDMHAHFSRWDGGLHLAAGITTIRDMGNSNDELQEMIEEQTKGELLAPQIITAGFLEGESEHSANLGFVIKDLEGAKRAIDWYSVQGYPQLKIYNSFPKAILRETVAYAHSRGLRVSGHVPAFLRAQDVVEAGFDEIQHINQVLLNFLVTPTTDTRTLDRFYLPAEKLADFDFTSKPVKDFLALLKKQGTVIDPTITTFNFIQARDGEMPEDFAPFADHLPPDVKRSLYSGSMKIPDDQTAVRYKKSYRKMLEFVGLMYKEGIPLVAGTDGMAGLTLHSELENYVRAGITPAQALQIATLNGAKYSRTSEDRGSIAPGKLADLVMVDGDPTQNISDIRKVVLVITGGKLIYPKELHQAIGLKPFVDGAPEVGKQADRHTGKRAN